MLLKGLAPLTDCLIIVRLARTPNMSSFRGYLPTLSISALPRYATYHKLAIRSCLSALSTSMD